jgi:hypothetical protein
MPRKTSHSIALPKELQAIPDYHYRIRVCFVSYRTQQTSHPDPTFRSYITQLWFETFS